jgi:hypothetical protein
VEDIDEHGIVWYAEGRKKRKKREVEEETPPGRA